MKKSPRVTFKMLRIAENDWQIAAECPGTETHYVEGLKEPLINLRIMAHCGFDSRATVWTGN